MTIKKKPPTKALGKYHVVDGGSIQAFLVAVDAKTPSEVEVPIPAFAAGLKVEVIRPADGVARVRLMNAEGGNPIFLLTELAELSRAVAQVVLVATKQMQPAPPPAPPPETVN